MERQVPDPHCASCNGTFVEKVLVITDVRLCVLITLLNRRLRVKKTIHARSRSRARHLTLMMRAGHREICLVCMHGSSCLALLITRGRSESHANSCNRATAPSRSVFASRTTRARFSRSLAHSFRYQHITLTSCQFGGSGLRFEISRTGPGGTQRTFVLGGPNTLGAGGRPGSPRAG